MQGQSFPRRIRLWLVLLPALVFASHASTEQTPSQFSVIGTETHLFAEPNERSQVITKLARGEKLAPLANTIGAGEAWYMVRTSKGAVGWLKSSQVQGTESIEKMWKESASLPSIAVLPETSSSAPPDKTITVPVEISGGSIVVPVIVNGSAKTYMVVDTGASRTLVTSALAKRLGLRLASRIPMLSVSGSFSAPLSRLASVKVGSAEVRGMVVAVHNFSPDPRLEGLLGLDFLSHFHTSIDSRQQRLTLAPR